MVRTQIQLTEEQARKAKQRAHKMEISVAELIRRTLDNSLAETPEDERAAIRERSLRVIGCARSRTGDLSVNHDKYLDEAYRR